MPVGSITRGTTNTNRLRRIDRWIADAVRAAPRHRRVRRRPRLRCERRDRARTRREARARSARRRRARHRDRPRPGAHRARAARGGARGRMHFAAGCASSSGSAASRCRRRAGAVRPSSGRSTCCGSTTSPTSPPPGRAWPRASQPGGLLVEGTCDELGRVASWVGVDASGPRDLHDQPAPFAASRPRRSWPSACPRRSSTATCPASASTSCSPRSTGRWRVHAPMSVYGPSQRLDRDRRDVRARGLARDRRAASHAARRAHRAVARGGSRLSGRARGHAVG